jgi:hypothetical protein
VTRGWRIALALAGAAVVLSLAAEQVDRATREPAGPRSSAFATAPEGLAAYADLLRRFGHPVRHLREAPAEAELEPGSTVVVLDPHRLLGDDSAALRRFVRSGGRLIAGGTAPGPWVERLAPGIEWSDAPANRARPLVPVPETAGVREVVSAGDGSWSDAGEALPVVAADGRPLAAVAALGEGRATLLADASPLQNRLLGRGDNAAFGLALAGATDRPVAFVESVHGYGRATGIRAIPWRWRWVLAGLTLAALVWLVSRGRRLGPPEREQRELPPPRRMYVEALGATLAKTRSPRIATAAVQAAARERLLREGTGAAGDDALRRAAARAGLSDEETVALLRPAASGNDLLLAGRALARVWSAHEPRPEREPVAP